jgi:hypothetical protein
MLGCANACVCVCMFFAYGNTSDSTVNSGIIRSAMEVSSRRRATQGRGDTCPKRSESRTSNQD